MEHDPFLDGAEDYCDILQWYSGITLSDNNIPSTFSALSLVHILESIVENIEITTPIVQQTSPYRPHEHIKVLQEEEIALQSAEHPILETITRCSSLHYADIFENISPSAVAHESDLDPLRLQALLAAYGTFSNIDIIKKEEQALKTLENILGNTKKPILQKVFPSTESNFDTYKQNCLKHIQQCAIEHKALMPSPSPKQNVQNFLKILQDPFNTYQSILAYRKVVSWIGVIGGRLIHIDPAGLYIDEFGPCLDVQWHCAAFLWKHATESLTFLWEDSHYKTIAAAFIRTHIAPFIAAHKDLAHKIHLKALLRFIVENIFIILAIKNNHPMQAIQRWLIESHLIKNTLSHEDYALQYRAKINEYTKKAPAAMHPQNTSLLALNRLTQDIQKGTTPLYRSRLLYAERPKEVLHTKPSSAPDVYKGPQYHELQKMLDRYFDATPLALHADRSCYLVQEIRRIMRGEWIDDPEIGFLSLIIGTIFIAEPLRYRPSYVASFMVLDLIEYRSHPRKWDNIFTNTPVNKNFINHCHTTSLDKDTSNTLPQDAKNNSTFKVRDMLGEDLFYQKIDGYYFMANQGSTDIHKNKKTRHPFWHPSKQKLSRIIIEWLHLALTRLGKSATRLPLHAYPIEASDSQAPSSDTWIHRLLEARSNTIAPLDNILQDIQRSTSHLPHGNTL